MLLFRTVSDTIITSQLQVVPVVSVVVYQKYKAINFSTQLLLYALRVGA